MRSHVVPRVRGPLFLLLVLTLSWSPPSPLVRADDPPAAQDSPLIKLLKTGKVPEDRQGTIVEMIGKRGGDADLAYVLQQATRADGFGPAIRRKALDALTEATVTRKAKPSGDLSGLRSLIEGVATEAELRRAAIRLAGLWKVESLAEPLRALALAPASPDPIRAASLQALAALGDDASRQAIEALAAPGQLAPVRVLAVSALATMDPDAAAQRAPLVLRDVPSGTDVQPMLAALLSRQDGVGRLVAALEKAPPTPDAAKLGLRAMYALGRADAALVAVFSKAAGLDAEVKPLSQPEMDALIAEVNTKGNPQRGEAVFRRVDLNCAKCHALGQAGGGVGPDLSAVGGSSPVDYLVNAILLPDQAIKEEYQTLIVLTADGQVYQGIVADKDDKRFLLKEATGEIRTIAADNVEDSKQGGSLMPKGLSNLVTHDEFVDLVRFLSELGKPGPYGIPTTPVVMRWRLLKPVGELAAAVPVGDEFRAQVLEADASRWLPVYAKVGGVVPLAEMSEQAASPIIYLKADLDVSQAGAVQVQLDTPEGVSVWIDDQPLKDVLKAELSEGRHPLTLRVDTTKRPDGTVKVEVVKLEGSSAEYVVVGGR